MMRSRLPQNPCGFIHILPLFIIVAAVGIISFLLISSTAPINGLFGKLNPKPQSFAATGVINVNPTTNYQTMGGWEATSQAGEIDSPVFTQYNNYLFDQAVTDLGINRLRVEIFTNSARTGFDFVAFDSNMRSVVLPMKQKVEARGEKFWFNVCYVFKDATDAPLTNPTTYAQATLTAYQHIQQTFGFIPDSWEPVLEPGNFRWPSATAYGNALVTTGDLLKQNGFPVYMVSPSSEAGVDNAINYYNQVISVVPRVQSSGYMKEFSFHNYGGSSQAGLQQAAIIGKNNNLQTGMLEHIGADYNELHSFIKDANISNFQQFTLAYPTNDNGAQYFVINNSGTTAQNQATLSSRAKFLRQYFRYIRRGAVRIGATSQNGNLDPLAFINTNGLYTVVVKANAATNFDIGNLPSGTYAIKYTTSSQADVSGTTQTVSTGQNVQASIPAAGVITIFQTTGGGPTPPPTATPTPIPTPTPTPTPAPCPLGPLGDADCSGGIDIQDYNAVLTDFNKTGLGLLGDIDKNQIVDIQDYNLVFTNFGL